jgi:hypothetical protein
MKEEASRAKGARKTLIWTGVTAGVFVVLVLALYAVVFSYERSYENRIFSGVQVLGVRLDGLTKVEASQAVESVADSSLAKGLQFSYRGEDVTLDVTSVSVDPDASHELVRYDIDQAVDRAFTLGRESNAASRFFDTAPHALRAHPHHACCGDRPGRHRGPSPQCARFYASNTGECFIFHHNDFEPRNR